MPALDALPSKIGPYRLLDKIGEGGMGVVYLARDAESRQVAVKILGPAVATARCAGRRLTGWPGGWPRRSPRSTPPGWYTAISSLAT